MNLRCGHLVLFAAVSATLLAAQDRAPDHDRWQECPATNSDVKRLRLHLLAKQTDGLHKAAIANCGSYSEFSEPSMDFARTLEELVAGSSTIFVGTVTAEEVLLVDDGRYLVTEYTFHPRRFFEGESSSAPLKLALPGGTYKFPDGTHATDSTMNPKLHIGLTYLIFTKPLRAGSQTQVLAFATQEVIHLEFDGVRVAPYSAYPGDPLGYLWNRTQTELFGEVEALVANKAASKSP